jgi:hypothetical protein
MKPGQGMGFVRVGRTLRASLAPLPSPPPRPSPSAHPPAMVPYGPLGGGDSQGGFGFCTRLHSAPSLAPQSGATESPPLPPGLSGAAASNRELWYPLLSWAGQRRA